MEHCGCVVFKIHVSHWIKNCTLGALQMKMTATCGIQKFRWREKIKHLSKYWGVVNTGRPLQVKYWGVATPAALTPMTQTDGPCYNGNDRPHLMLCVLMRPWASAHRGKWGQLTPPRKMDEKLKGENMQKRAIFYVYVIFWEQSGQAGV